MASGTTPYRPTNNRLEAVISRQTLSTLLAAWVLHHTVELPFLRLRDRFVPDRPRVAADAAGTDWRQRREVGDVLSVAALHDAGLAAVARAAAAPRHQDRNRDPA
jgi:peptidoglycan/LPS O-acetylase OafA/YrhL